MSVPLHVIVGAGPLGLAVARALKTRDGNVRLVSRSGHGSPDGGVEAVAADASDGARMAEVCAGAAVVYQCAQPPYARWPTLFPPLMDGVLAGARASGAKLICGGNLYMYGRVRTPLEETLPDRPAGPNGRVRAEIAGRVLAAHAGGEVRAAIARASDFYGPHVTTSTLGERVFGRALRGQAAQVLGDPDTPHSFTFIDDFGEALVLLGEREEALGQVWHVPSGDALTMRQVVGMVYRELDAAAKLAAMPGWLIRFLGVFDPTMRAVGESLYQSEAPWVIDSTKFVEAFGDIATPTADAVSRTIQWYRERLAAA